MLIESDDDSAVGLSSDIGSMRSSSHENEVSGKIRSDGESENEYEVRGGVDVRLIEINSSPAVADKLLPRFVDNLIQVVIDKNFPREEQGLSGTEGKSPVSTRHSHHLLELQ
jgi:hypothetical protein